MYDTINFNLTADDVRGVDFLNEIPCYLDTDGLGYHSYNGLSVVTGNLNGLRVSVSRWQVKVKDGSLCKYFLGDNYQTLGRGDTQRAIEKLSDGLHLPMGRAKITRMDVAHNIILKHPVSVYLGHLGLLRYATRLVEPNGLYYTLKNGRLCFYDKNKEQRTKGDPIPELYAGRNLLRYELRYTHRLQAQFGVMDVTGALLYDEAFYMDVAKRWLGYYKDIAKINDITLNFQAMKSKKDFYKMGLLSLTERMGGEVEMYNHINEAQKRGELTSKQAFDIRQAVRESCKVKDGLTIPNEAIEELDRKIREAARYYR